MSKFRIMKDHKGYYAEVRVFSPTANDYYWVDITPMDRTGHAFFKSTAEKDIKRYIKRYAQPIFIKYYDA